jgi:hypothetical protein
VQDDDAAFAAVSRPLGPGSGSGVVDHNSAVWLLLMSRVVLVQDDDAAFAAVSRRLGPGSGSGVVDHNSAVWLLRCSSVLRDAPPCCVIVVAFRCGDRLPWFPCWAEPAARGSTSLVPTTWDLRPVFRVVRVRVISFLLLHHLLLSLREEGWLGVVAAEAFLLFLMTSVCPSVIGDATLK